MAYYYFLTFWLAESARWLAGRNPLWIIISLTICSCALISSSKSTAMSTGLWLACSACQKGLYLAIYYGQVDEYYQSAVFAPTARFTRLRVPITKQEQPNCDINHIQGKPVPQLCVLKGVNRRLLCWEKIRFIFSLLLCNQWQRSSQIPSAAGYLWRTCLALVTNSSFTHNVSSPFCYWVAVLCFVL